MEENALLRIQRKPPTKLDRLKKFNWAKWKLPIIIGVLCSLLLLIKLVIETYFSYWKRSEKFSEISKYIESAMSSAISAIDFANASANHRLELKLGRSVNQ